MSFLTELLINSKKRLKHTVITITLPDGRKLLEDTTTSTTKVLSSTSHGFVIDTKPDKIPAKITDNIFLGSQDCTDLNILSTHNINYVLSIGVQVEHHPGIIYKYVPCLDLPETDICQIIKTNCFDFIKDAIVNGKKILVHCNAGVSRSSAVVIGYLMLVDNLKYDKAYEVVKRVREVAQPNPGFVDQLKRIK